MGTQKVISSGSSLSDVTWATWTILKDPNGIRDSKVGGLWGPRGPKKTGTGTDTGTGTEIKSIFANKPNEKDPNKGLLVVGMNPQINPADVGLVLYRYPCKNECDQGKNFFGHSSFVTNVMFTADGKHVISTGGRDLCVMQWRLE